MKKVGFFDKRYSIFVRFYGIIKRNGHKSVISEQEKTYTLWTNERKSRGAEAETKSGSAHGIKYLRGSDAPFFRFYQGVCTVFA